MVDEAVDTSADINSLSLMQEIVEVDDAADSAEFFNPPLPDDGEYEVVLALGNRGVKADRQRDGKGANAKKTGPAFLNVHLQLKKVDPTTGGEGGTLAFDSLTTIVMGNSGTSRVHALFDLAGHKLPSRASLGELKTAIETAIAQAPHAMASTRWEAQYKDKDGNYQDVLKGQKAFPPLPDASDGSKRFDPEVTAPNGEKVRAQVRVTKYGAVKA